MHKINIDTVDRIPVETLLGVLIYTNIEIFCTQVVIQAAHRLIDQLVILFRYDANGLEYRAHGSIFVQIVKGKYKLHEAYR